MNFIELEAGSRELEVRRPSGAARRKKLPASDFRLNPLYLRVFLFLIEWDCMLKRFFAIIRILSLDVVLGACAGSMFIARYLQVKLPWLHLIALALSVWLIYTADHLADAYQVKHAAHSSRHLYHQQHFHKLSIIFLGVLTGGLVLLFYLPVKLISWGLVLVAFVGVYFLIIKLLPYPRNYYKEFMTALLYAAGIFLSPVSLYPHTLSVDIILAFFQFVLIALANLIIFALYEADLDEKDGHLSFVLLIGTKKAKWVVYACLIVVLCIGMLSITIWPTHQKLLLMQGLFSLMTLTLLLIIALPAFFQQEERYRIVGDAVFLFPMLTLLF